MKDMYQGQNIQVFVRCRPLNSNEKRSVVEVLPERREIKVLDRNASTTYETKNFYFDQVFSPDARQTDVHKTVVRPLVDQVLLGFNCTVFAYGQTGTGKTYTMEGDRSDEDLSWEDDPHSGIIPRAISQLFDSLNAHDNEFTVRVSFLELYNEDTYDLLSSIDDTTKLRIFEDAQGSVIVGGLQEICVQSKDEIYDILKRGSLKRQTATTLINACSSRSHTIFNITVCIKESSIDGAELIKTGKLNMVDLAGSENIGRSGAQDKRAREAGNINQSLLTLGRVITALVENRPHTPYRESKLTRILKDSLGGPTRTSIIATISPAESDLANTVSTLDYASRARNIVNRPESNQRLIQQDTFAEHHRYVQTLIEKHSCELSELEFKVRNEVAQEFKREIEKMKRDFDEQYESDRANLKATYELDLKRAIEQRDKLSSDIQDIMQTRDRYELQLKEALEQRDRLETELKKAFDDQDRREAEYKSKLKQLEDDLEHAKAIDQTLNKLQEQVREYKEREENSRKVIDEKKHSMKVMEQLAEYRAQLAAELEDKLKERELELKNLREENIELREKLEDRGADVKKATRVRGKAAPVLEECGEYANMTFDGGDEIAQLSTKKARKGIVAVCQRKRQINESIMLSGKKRKLKNTDLEADLSPIPTNVRVTRSRATKRKLAF